MVSALREGPASGNGHGFVTADTRAVSVANRHPRLRLDRPELERAIRVLDAEFAATGVRRSAPRRTCPPGELSIVFLTDAALARLHAEFLDDPSATDVITFAGEPALGVAGEICVSADAARRVAKEIGGRSAPAGARRPGRTGADPLSAELTLYIAHGWLHLAGYDDLEPAKKRVMRRAEARAMALLRRTGMLPRFGWR